MGRIDSLLAFVGGAAIGVTLGILFAPDKGENTREKIKEILRRKGVELDEDEIGALAEELHHTMTHSKP